VVPAKATPALSEEKIKQLDNDAEMLLEEYILSYDELEAGECIKELKAPEYHYKVVSKVPHPLAPLVRLFLLAR
jgi:hypothetical protein